MTQSIVPQTGLNALLTPEESVLILIDHEPLQFANLHSRKPTMIVNNRARQGGALRSSAEQAAIVGDPRGTQAIALKLLPRLATRISVRAN